MNIADHIEFRGQFPEDIPLKEDGDGVCRVGGTRVTLDTIVLSFEAGASAEEIASRYPAVQLADVYASIGYYLRHKDRVDDYIARRREEADRVRVSTEARFDPNGLRARLLSRRKQSA